jgi:CRISPR/Cas system-associated protein Cas7 (RAMP superfamily)
VLDEKALVVLEGGPVRVVLVKVNLLGCGGWGDGGIITTPSRPSKSKEKKKNRNPTSVKKKKKKGKKKKKKKLSMQLPVQNDASWFLYARHSSGYLIGRITNRAGFGISSGSVASMAATMKNRIQKNDSKKKKHFIL